MSTENEGGLRLVSSTELHYCWGTGYFIKIFKCHQFCKKSFCCLSSRVSSKQSNFFFGSNRNKPKLNLFRLFFGLFRETKKHLFRFVLVFRTGIETTETKKNFHETNRNKPKKTEKISKKRFLLGSPRNHDFFLGLKNRNKPKLNLFRLFFGWLLHETKKFFFRFVSVCFGLFQFVLMFRTGIETTKTNRNYSMGN